MKPFSRSMLVYYPHHRAFTLEECLLFLMGHTPEFVHELKARGVERVVLEETGNGTSRPGYTLHWAEINDWLPDEGEPTKIQSKGALGIGSICFTSV